MANIFDGIGPTTTSSQTINNNLFNNTDKSVDKKKNLFDDIGPENDFKITTEGDTNDVGISAINKEIWVILVSML